MTRAAALAGSATVTLFNGCDPPAGSTYDLLTAASISGTFTPLNLPPLLNEKCWHVDYNADSIRLTVYSPPVITQQPVGGEICRNAVYNCCLDNIRVTLDAQGSFLRLQEKELQTMGCHCLCCYDATTMVEGLVPGAYRIEYCWLDDDYGYTCLKQDVIVSP